jgi:DNA-binding NarL/FixJ family response regulator
MNNQKLLVGFDHNARFIHLFHAEAVDAPVDPDEFMGKTLGSYAANDVDARLARATFAECLFTNQPQECMIAAKSGAKYRFRFEKVIHRSQQTLRPDDEVAVLGLVSEVPPSAELTGRERQIVKLICCDMSNLEIASQLKITASTVETHRQNIRQKLGVRGTAGLVLHAVRQGLVD